MPERRILVFLTLHESGNGEVVLRAAPETVVASIEEDGTTDTVVWEYTTQPPNPFPAIAEPPAPAEVNLEIRFPPAKTPFPLNAMSASAQPNSLRPVEPDDGGFSNVGTVEITPDAPRENAVIQTDPEEQDNNVIYNFKNFKYAVILTSLNDVYTLDPNYKLRRFNRHA